MRWRSGRFFYFLPYFLCFCLCFLFLFFCECRKIVTCLQMGWDYKCLSSLDMFISRFRVNGSFFNRLKSYMYFLFFFFFFVFNFLHLFLFVFFSLYFLFSLFLCSSNITHIFSLLTCFYLFHLFLPFPSCWCPKQFAFSSDDFIHTFINCRTPWIMLHLNHFLYHLKQWPLLSLITSNISMLGNCKIYNCLR